MQIEESPDIGVWLRWWVLVSICEAAAPTEKTSADV